MDPAELDLAGAGAGADAGAGAGGAGDGDEAPRPPQLVQDTNGEWPCDLCNGKVCSKTPQALATHRVSCEPRCAECRQLSPRARSKKACKLCPPPLTKEDSTWKETLAEHRRAVGLLTGIPPGASNWHTGQHQGKGNSARGGRGLNVRPGRSDPPASNDAGKNPVPAANDASDGGKRDAANEQNELNDNTNKSPVEPSPAARNLQQDADAGVKTAIDLVWNDLSPAATTSAGDANLGSRIHLKQLGITAKDWSKGIAQRQDIANKLITNVGQVKNTPARDRLFMALGGLGFIGQATDTSPDPLPEKGHRNMPPWLDPGAARTRLEEGLQCQQHWAQSRSKPLQATPAGNGNPTKDYGLCPALHLSEADLEHLLGRRANSEPKAAGGTGASPQAKKNDRPGKNSTAATKPTGAASTKTTKGGAPQLSQRVQTMQDLRKKDRELRAAKQRQDTPPLTTQLPRNKDDTQRT